MPNKPITILQILPYVGPFIIFLGVVRLIYFYSAFGVEILSFLDFSEIITSFLDITALIILIFLYVIIQSVFFHPAQSPESQKVKFEKLLAEHNFLKLVILYIQYLSIIIIFMTISDLVLAICYFYFKSVSGYELFWVNCFFASLLIFSIAVVEIERHHQTRNSSINYRQYISIVSRTIVLLVVVFDLSAYQIHNVKVNKTNYGVTIYLDSNKMLKSDSSNYYIGNSKNYLFYYHEKTETTDVYPIGKVKQLTFINKMK